MGWLSGLISGSWVGLLRDFGCRGCSRRMVRRKERMILRRRILEDDGVDTWVLYLVSGLGNWDLVETMPDSSPIE